MRATLHYLAEVAMIALALVAVILLVNMVDTALEVPRHIISMLP